MRMRILPVAELFIASDDDPRHEGEFATDFVAAYTAATRLCDALTPRPDVERALDVGTGSGVHALLTARHAKQVIATDVNVRALAFTELNAALNGIRNAEVREGSLFEPVEGETFDLITCNAPYVVSPETRWAYRDGGFAADEVSERVVKTAASHLNDGGYAALLVSWLGYEEASPTLGRSGGSTTPTATRGSFRSGAETRSTMLRRGTTISRTTPSSTRRHSRTGRAISTTSVSHG